MECRLSSKTRYPSFCRVRATHPNLALACLLVPYQGTYEVILIFWSDDSEVSSQILASRSSVAPFESRIVDYMVTKISMKNPVSRTF